MIHLISNSVIKTSVGIFIAVKGLPTAFFLVVFSNVSLQTSSLGMDAKAEDRHYSPVSFVDPMIGVRGEGSCVPGPSMPHGSIHPSPETHAEDNTAGYKPDGKIVGFAQLHAQGTGGVPSYGNILVSPMVGQLRLDEKERASGKRDERASATYYRVHLTKYDISCELSAAEHTAIYRFTFPKSKEVHIIIDMGRKINGEPALKEGSIEIHPGSRTTRGRGIYHKNWNPAEYGLSFYARFSKAPKSFGTWDEGASRQGEKFRKIKGKGGAYFSFETEDREVIYLKVAVSFKDMEKARIWAENEIPGWSLSGVQARARAVWNRELGTVSFKGGDVKDRIKFYTSLYHSQIHPRNRTSDNGGWNSDEPFWDDFYTVWDSWKTAIPLLTIRRPLVARDIVRSFIERFKHNGYVSSSFIQGKEFLAGQGGNDVDNVIADAYVKGVSGIDWPSAYEVLKYHAEYLRTDGYRLSGFTYIGEPNIYTWRLRSGSATQAFAYNDFAISQVAKGLLYLDDHAYYLKRSENWKNVWDSSAQSDGFTGFARGRNADGTFAGTDPKDLKDESFYEGSSWVYSYLASHDVGGLIQKMGGRDTFVKRLEHALEKGLIDFTNEPSFQTIWYFSNDLIDRMDLTSKWVRRLLRHFPHDGYPGDEDNGAMSSLYIFLVSGIYPFAGQDIYYLHAPVYPETVFHLEDGKKFRIIAPSASREDVNIRKIYLNGRVLGRNWIRHGEITRGGTLMFDMGKQ
ncbi:MAG: GH92 family glycosyl hydrolase [Oligoflexales bacterium]|nr:GH92 family glycosyl hydrolase [Oligoflexales bacterium]